MSVRVHDSVEEFREIAEPLYRRDPVGNTIELTVLQGARFGDDTLLLSVWDGSTAIGAALQTPPYPLACNGLPVKGRRQAALELAHIRPDFTGVRGARDNALAFADAWQAITGRRGAVTMHERLYRLGMLQPPSGVAGEPRQASRDDTAVLLDWVERFFVETFSHQRDDAAGRRFLDNAHAVGDRFVLWEIDRTPVSMAMLRAPAAGVSRIGPVFTPRALRGRGYGSAVTAAASVLALGSGVNEVVLFADLTNPMSNAIYQRIGFEAVIDSVRVDFTSSSSSG
ncbi:GNAT family N-acetyltransferase [Mycobacterium sp. 1274761.0]|uniref:GNAT family N-acetyltransferase n=1 Tax=Mycobacterium sp. 1274761.0 TaxID=1834077 RepID=UPI000800ED29|nr:GNAT family N-acetyltransferase [Mycobacterium sp. 1274761.0]OBK78816.1 acetyltransferase [Mycobacterium sp. 1274761.0]